MPFRHALAKGGANWAAQMSRMLKDMQSVRTTGTNQKVWQALAPAISHYRVACSELKLKECTTGKERY